MKNPIRKDERILGLELAIGSRTAIRILRLFSSYPNEEFSIYRIIASTGLAKRSVKSRLQPLVKSGLVKKQSSEMPTYQFNVESKVARALKEFFAESEMI